MPEQTDRWGMLPSMRASTRTTAKTYESWHVRTRNTEVNAETGERWPRFRRKGPLSQVGALFTFQARCTRTIICIPGANTRRTLTEEGRCSRHTFATPHFSVRLIVFVPRGRGKVQTNNGYGKTTRPAVENATRENGTTRSLSFRFSFSS